MFGILNINKPKNLTSHDVIDILRKILKIRQIGHTGTLDPLATGVLPICIGKATKLIQYLDDTKAYRAFIKLGIKTNTYDSEGIIVADTPVNNLDTFELDKILKEFQGEITQIPPLYSAIHYKGKRLYEYARSNIAIDLDDLPERKIFINSLKLVEILDAQSVHPVIVLDIDCSKGTYIRSIANDLGEKLGFGASLDNLIRTQAGKFLVEESHSLEEIKEFHLEGNLDNFIINPVNAIDLESYEIDETQLDKIKKGQFIDNFTGITSINETKIQLLYQNKLASIAKIQEGKILPVNVFI